MSYQEEPISNGNIYSGMPGSTTTGSAPALQRTRSVHLVIEGNNNNNKQENSAKPAKRKRGPTKSDSSSLLSVLYCILTILIGLLFPLTEALHGIWLNTEYYTAFIVYQYVLACAFLLYMQLYLLRQPDGRNKPKHKVFDAAQIKATSTGIHITDARDQSDPATEPFQKQSRYRKAVNHLKSVRGGAGGSGRTENHGVNGGSRVNSGTSISAGIRYTNSVSNLNGEPLSRSTQEHLSSSSTLSSHGGDQDQLGDYVDEDSFVWIDTGKLGNLFSHEGSSFYLRMGCVLFAIGNLIYVALEIETSSQSIAGCPDTPYWWTYVFRLVFILLQTFFIFKYPSISIPKHEPLVRFGFMHLISTNMGVWIRTLVNEIALEYNHLSHLPYANKTQDTPHIAEMDSQEEMDDFKSRRLLAAAEETVNCRGILQGAAQYLFPFVLEYSLIAMGTFIIMYFSINERSHNDSNAIQGLSNLIRIQALVEEPTNGGGAAGLSDDFSSVSSKVSGRVPGNILRKSHRGLFAGILLLSGSIISCVMFFFQLADHPLTAQIIFLSMDIALHLFLLFGALMGIARLNVLNYVEKPVSVDDVLLLLSMAGSITFELTLVISAGDYLVNGQDEELTTSILTLCSGIIASAQSVVQVILITSGMRRYPSKQKHIDQMPGRGYVTFLLVGNVALWIYRTLQAKELELHVVELNYYGNLTWLLLINVSLPLLLFFRFHSSICLADVWHSAYEPLHHKIKKVHSAPNTALPLGASRRDLHGRPSTSSANDGYVGNALMMNSSLLKSISMGNLSNPDSKLRSGNTVRGRGFENLAVALDDIESVADGNDLYM